MAIQIFGISKSFDVKKAERYFSDRRITFQKVDLKEKNLSKGEFESVVSALAKKTGSRSSAIEMMADKKNKDYSSFSYLDDDDKETKLFENQLLIIMPIVRNGKDKATVGYCPDEWESWC